MFDIKLFSEILQKISNTYSSISEFAEKSEVNRTYLSKYINMKLENPPTPKILERIANNSNEIVSYAQLMEICGYLNFSLDFEGDQIKQKTEYIVEQTDYLLSIGLNQSQITELQYIVNMDFSSKEYKFALDTFLSKLPSDTYYSLSIFLRNMLSDLRADDEEKLKLAQALQKEVNELLDKAQSIKELDEIKKKYSNHKKTFFICPVYGKISAGLPNWAEECLEGYLPIDPNLMGIINPEECFFLRVDGESMNKVIRNGAYALIRKQDTAEDGDIVAAIVNGDNEATLKKFKRFNEQFVSFEPVSADNSFKPINVDLKTTNVIILGKYIGKFEMN